MPYLKEAERIPLNAGGEAKTPGEFAYVATMNALADLPAGYRFADLARCAGRMFKDAKDLDQSDEIVGARVCAMLEFYRRKVVRYERQAIERNGDLPGYRECDP